jgi:ribosomal protein S18 acetylase RimI-like enzyme
MDIIIKRLSKGFLGKNIQMFIDILKDEPDEYWQEEHFKKELDGKFILSFIALYKDDLVGYIIASVKQKEAYIHKFMALREYRSRGIGTRLQREFEAKVEQLDLQKISLTILFGNNKALKFYEKNGFNKIGERIDTITLKTLIIMEKIIQ